MSGQHPAQTTSSHQKKFSLDHLKTLRVTSCHPLPDDVYKFLVPLIQISPDEWYFIFDMFAGAPSTHRNAEARNGTDATIEMQAQRLPTCIYDHMGCISVQPEDLARRVSQMPKLFRIVILEAAERFWTPRIPGTVDDVLGFLGIPKKRSAHQLILAAMLEKLLDTDE